MNAPQSPAVVRPPRGALKRGRLAGSPSNGSRAAVRFKIQALPCPETLPRLLGYAAQLGLIPERVRAQATDGMITVVIELRGLDDHRAGIVANKMRSAVLVQSVTLMRGRRLVTDAYELAQ